MGKKRVGTTRKATTTAGPDWRGSRIGDSTVFYSYTDHFFNSQRQGAPEHFRNEALKMKLDAAEVKHRGLEAELDEKDEKMRQMQAKVGKKEREWFRLATDSEEYERQARELAKELDDTKRMLLDKTTEALIEKKRSEELQARTKTTDAELRRLAEEVEAQQRELLELRQDAAERLEGRGSRRINEREYEFGRDEEAADLQLKVEDLTAELKATKELLQQRVTQVEELRHELQAAGGLHGWRQEELLAQKEGELAAAKAEVVELRTQLARAELPAETSPREGRHSGSRRSKTRRPQRSSSGEGLAAYADSLRASGSESYHEAMARSSGKARGGMSLEDIASAASPYDFESPGGGAEPKWSGKPSAEGSAAEPTIHLLRSASGGNPKRSPANSPRGNAPSRSPRNARNGSEPESPRGGGGGRREAEAAPQAAAPKLHLAAYSQAAGQQLSAPPPGRHRWAGSSQDDGSSSSDDEGGRSWQPRTAISVGSSPGQDLEELRRRLQSFKADTAVSILGKSQAVKAQLRRMHSSNQ
eukprot:jgi/Tetstr1/421201/TSEL_001106.t2